MGTWNRWETIGEDKVDLCCPEPQGPRGHTQPVCNVGQSLTYYTVNYLLLICKEESSPHKGKKQWDLFIKMLLVRIGCLLITLNSYNSKLL